VTTAPTTRQNPVQHFMTHRHFRPDTHHTGTGLHRERLKNLSACQARFVYEYSL